MPYIGSAPAQTALTAAHIDAGAVDSSEIATGAVDIAHLSASGTAGSGNFLRGDNSWQAAGGDLSFGGDTFGANKVIGANDAYSLSLETSGNTALTIDATGAVTMPLQPCVLVHPTSAQNNIATNTSTTIVWGTEIFDVGGDFASNTFTAPVTGKYLAAVSLDMDNLDQDATYYQIQCAASNRDRYGPIIDPAGFDEDLVYGFLSKTIILDMDANDTLTVLIRQDGSGAGNQTDLRTDSTLSICLIA